MKCTAEEVLTDEDWEAIRFYSTVADQVLSNSAPDIAAYKLILELHGYPEDLYPWYIQSASMIYKLTSGIDVVDWWRELGKGIRSVTPEDVAEPTFEDDEEDEDDLDGY